MYTHNDCFPEDDFFIDPGMKFVFNNLMKLMSPLSVQWRMKNEK